MANDTIFALTPLCPKCGYNSGGVPNCCGRGGSWQGTCTVSLGKGGEHTWDDGFFACHPELAELEARKSQVEAERESREETERAAREEAAMQARVMKTRGEQEANLVGDASVLLRNFVTERIGCGSHSNSPCGLASGRA